MVKKKKKRNRRPPSPFQVITEYKFSLHGFELEGEIEKLVGKGRFGGSGYCFDDDLRDTSFDFATRRMAIARAKRIKQKLGRKVRVRVEGRIWP